MTSNKLMETLQKRNVTVSFENVLNHSRANSGGERDVTFLKYLVENGLLVMSEAILKRTILAFDEEFFLEKYKKFNYESDRHFICRTLLQEELSKLKIHTFPGIDVGNMSVLRLSSNYDIVTEDLNALIDIGLTPARNFFRGITDIRVKSYLVTTYYDDYMDDIIFSCFSRSNDDDYLDCVRDFEEGFKMYIPKSQPQVEDPMYYDSPSI